MTEIRPVFTVYCNFGMMGQPAALVTGLRYVHITVNCNEGTMGQLVTFDLPEAYAVSEIRKAECMRYLSKCLNTCPRIATWDRYQVEASTVASIQVNDSSNRA